MSRRSAVEQIVIEEKKVTESIFKLISAREKASAWHLKWAKFEEHHFLFFLFGKLAELRWIWNDLLNRFVDRHQEYYKTFKDIHYEERVIEDTKKTLQTCESSIAKLKKQMESAQKRNDSSKIQAVDRELTSQMALQEHLRKNINSRSERLSHFKVEQIQKGLLIQAQAGIQMAEQLRHLFIAQLRIADIVGNPSLTTAVICQMVSQVIIGLSNALGIFPPPTGNVDPLPSPSESPTQSRKSNSESSPLPSPLGFSTSADVKCGRRSFPFPYRPLPQEPTEADHPTQSHPPPPTHKGKGVAFTRSASDVPLRERKASRSSPNHTYRASLVILEEVQRGTELLQTRSQSVSRASSANSLKEPVTVSLLDSSSDINHSILKPSPNQLILKQDSSSLDHGKMIPMGAIDTASLGSESDPGYADPIDALREYYSSQAAHKGPGMQEDLSNGPEISDPPYQTLAQIQERRQWQVLQEAEQNPEDDPTYSKPFDCLVGLAAPIRVTSDTVPSRKLTVSPLAMHRTVSPDFARTITKSHHRRHAIRKHIIRKASGSEETLSSSPSPEPETGALLRPHRCTSLDSLLNPADDFSLLSRSGELRERVKSTGNLLDDKPIKAVIHRGSRERIRSLGNLLTAKGSYTFGQRATSPLALTRVVSDQDVIPRSSSSSIVSPQPSPLHAPVPAEVTRLQNGYATVVHPEYS